MKIITVDDNEDSRIILRETLLSQSHTVEAAINGEEALKMARESPPDMIISDILMPVMDGFTLCRECKGDERLRKIPFIFYTATYTDEKDEELALRTGADRFVQKPAEPDELIRIIEDVMRDAQEDKIPPGGPAVKEDKEIYKLYSERLVNKLEKKMLDLKEEVAMRKQAEGVLQKSEMRFRELANLLPQTVFEMDERGNLTFVNLNALNVFGYTQEEFDKRQEMEALKAKFKQQ